MGRESIQEPPVTLSPGHLVTLSGTLAWLALLRHCLQRQARARQMVWIALGLLAFTAVLVAVNTAAGNWGMGHRRYRMQPQDSRAAVSAPSASTVTTRSSSDSSPGSERVVVTYDTAATAVELSLSPLIWPGPLPTPALVGALGGSARTALNQSGFFVFSTWVVFSIFTAFLLPIFSLSFATEALGGEREGRTLVWLFSRPLPRWSVYLAKFLALLPWSLGLNLGGFAIICFLAGAPGRLAFELFWPVVFGATLAYAALYHLMGACFRRAAVVALVYSFFLETILGSMPGYLKRVSISFYTRCLMFDLAEGYDIYTEKPSIYLPVDGATAWCVLGVLTAGLLAIGMWVFSRTEYQDLT
jgi:ABC-2 type transport system permease protein